MKRKVLAAALMIVALGPVASAWALGPVPRPEHPRPDFEREAIQILNGQWSFSLDPADRGLAERWWDKRSLGGTILVPFPVESELSGVGDQNPPPVMWYARGFDLDESLSLEGPAPHRLLLHFGAVDYQATVWLNGVKLGEHVGGYTPFSFDVTDVVKPSGNHLAVRVFDSKDPMQVRGKQTTTGKSYSIFYTTVSGIWQSVWLERVGDPYLKSYRFRPASDLSGGTFSLVIEGETNGLSADIRIVSPAGKVELARWEGRDAVWRTESPRPWSPDDPALYEVEIRLVDGAGRALDSVRSYVGIRTIETRGGKVFLNGEEFYQQLLLDQGYFPGGIYTPADDEIMRSDVEMFKRMGFNGIRKHQKIEDPRFLYWCDKLGLVVWAEMPSLGIISLGTPPGWARERFREEWMAVIERDYNHPSIIVWTVFNESWGIQNIDWSRTNRGWAQEMVKATREADPTRLVVDNSGGRHFDTDLWDFHHYLSTVERSQWLYERYDLQPGDRRGDLWTLMAALTGHPVLPTFARGVRYQGQPIILSEYGGFGFYRTAGEKSLLELYRDYTLAVAEHDYIQGYCYTQPYDVEQEQNGLMTFDRIPKVEPEKIRELNEQVRRK